jgi:hypothetical protein
MDKELLQRFVAVTSAKTLRGKISLHRSHKCFSQKRDVFEAIETKTLDKNKIDFRHDISIQ